MQSAHHLTYAEHPAIAPLAMPQKLSPTNHHTAAAAVCLAPAWAPHATTHAMQRRNPAAALPKPSLARQARARCCQVEGMPSVCCMSISMQEQLGTMPLLHQCWTMHVHEHICAEPCMACLWRESVHLGKHTCGRSSVCSATVCQQLRSQQLPPASAHCRRVSRCSSAGQCTWPLVFCHLRCTHWRLRGCLQAVEKAQGGQASGRPGD